MQTITLTLDLAPMLHLGYQLILHILHNTFQTTSDSPNQFS